MRKLILFVVCCIIGCMNISALENDSEVTYQYIDNIYSNRQIDGNFYTGPQGIVYVNGKLAYCLDASLILNQSIYSSSSDFSVRNIDEKTLNYLELVSYFGYGYENRQNSKYYLAVQEIIWEVLSGGEIYWTNGKGGEVINIDSYKNDILNKVEHYKLSPTFPNNLEIYVNEDIIVEDKNNILQYYEVSELGNIVDNKLILNAKTKGIQKVTLTKKPLSYNTSFIYYCEGSQTLATFGYSSNNNETIELEYEVKNKFKLTLVIKDKETDRTIKNRKTQIKLFDVIRDKYITENESDTLTIDEKGELTLNDYLVGGIYRVEEISAPLGYKKLKNNYIFVINDNENEEKIVTIYNEPKKYSISINKEIEIFSGIYRPEIGIGGVYNFEPGNNITYGLYALEDIFDEEGKIKYEKDSLITEINIENGVGSYQNIPYGRYYLKELTCPNNYKLDETITELSLIDEVYEREFHFQNKLKKGNLTIRKTNNNVGLPGAVFKLYGDKYLTTITVTSDELGYIKLKEMPYDLYHLKEIEAPIGYIIEEEEKSILLETATQYYEFENKKEKEEIMPEEPPESEGNNEPDEEDKLPEENETFPEQEMPVEPEMPDEPIVPEEPEIPDGPKEEPPAELEQPKDEILSPPEIEEPEEEKEQENPIVPEMPDEPTVPEEPEIPDEPKEEPSIEPEFPKNEGESANPEIDNKEEEKDSEQIEPIIPETPNVPTEDKGQEENEDIPDKDFSEIIEDNNTQNPEENVEVKVENPSTHVKGCNNDILYIILCICILLKIKKHKFALS